MTKNERETFAAKVYEVHASLGGAANVEEIAHAVANALGDKQYREHTWPGFVQLIRNALRQTDTTGLVKAASINGTYVQRTLWEEGDYRYVIRYHARRSVSDKKRAYLYAKECQDRLGVWINPAEYVGEAEAEAAS